MPPKLLSRIGPREKFGLILALFCIVFLVVDNLVIRPMVARCQELDVSIGNVEKTHSLYIDIIATSDVVDRMFNRIRSKLGPSVPSAKAIVQMKREIDELANSTDVTLNEIKHRDPAKREFYDEYFVDIGDFETNEASLLRFLHGLRQLPGTFQVASLKLSPGTDSDRVKGSMTITKVMMPYAAVRPQG